VNSFNELFQTSPLESNFFEGLDELIPLSVLHNFEASTQIVPQPQALVLDVDPPTQPEAGPS
jgi:hypothetical protein